MSHVLVVEDDASVLHALQATLGYEGLTTSPASTAAQAFQRMRRQSFTAILLDLGLPDCVESHVVHAVRNESDVPLIVVSGRSDERSIIAALDAGADDYIVKPFMPGELLARLRAVLRRGSVRCGSPPRATEPQLGYTANRLIVRLQANEGEVVSNADLIAAVWGSDAKRTNSNLRVLVGAVRRKLSVSQCPFAIVNVHGRGYRIEPIDEDVRPRYNS